MLEVARALTFQSGLHLSFWGESVLTAAFIFNRLPSSCLNNKCPYELLYNKSVDYSQLKAFGCLAFSMNPMHITDKFKPRGVPCIFVGYPPTQKGFLLLDLKTMQIFVYRDVSFNETIFPLNVNSPKPYMMPLPTEMPHKQMNMYIDDDFSAVSLSDNPHTIQTPIDTLSHEAESSSDVIEDPVLPTSPQPTPSNLQTPTPPRKSSRPHKPPTWMESYVTQPFPKPSANCITVTTQPTSPKFFCFLTTLTTRKDPVLFKYTVQDINWVNAMNLELAALEANDTWDITTLPPNKKVIGCKWMYKTKFTPDGAVERYKSRLVILGCKQTYGFDYQHPFAPVAR